MMQLRWDLFKKLKIIIPRAPSLFKVVSLSIHGSDIYTKRMRLYLHHQKGRPDVNDYCRSNIYELSVYVESYLQETQLMTLKISTAKASFWFILWQLPTSLNKGRVLLSQNGFILPLRVRRVWTSKEQCICLASSMQDFPFSNSSHRGEGTGINLERNVLPQSATTAE